MLESFCFDPENATPTQRILELVRQLQQRHLTTRELVPLLFGRMDSKSQVFKNKQRDVQRYLQQLEQDYGFEICEDPAKPNKKFIASAGKDGLAPLEALALHAATRMLYHHAPNRTYRKALNRLLDFLPSKVREQVRGSVLDIENRSREDKILEQAARAWFLGQRLSFGYLSSSSSSGKWRDNELEVYFIEIHRSNLGVYIIGRETAYHNKILTLKASRMRNPVILEQTYQIPKDFDIHHYFEGALGVMGRSTNSDLIEIELRFAKEVRKRVLENDFPNLTNIRNGHGETLEATLTAGLDSHGVPLEAMPFILGWGAKVEVCSPVHIRELWLAEIRLAFEKYAKPCE
jgi:predicted DNA-binding transcriptional regulator YafY